MPGTETPTPSPTQPAKVPLMVAAAVAAVAVVGFGAYQLGGRNTPDVPAATVPASDAELADWEKQYEAEQKDKERQARRAERWDKLEKEQKEREYQQERAQDKKEQAARRSQLPPTAATYEALLIEDKAQWGQPRRGGTATYPTIATAISQADKDEKEKDDNRRSDLFWLRGELAKREGFQTALDVCGRVYGAGDIPRHETCQKFTEDGI